MRYKNIKTGTVIDSPFKLSGDNWEVISTENNDLRNAESGNMSQQELVHLLREKEKENTKLKVIISELKTKDTKEAVADKEETEEKAKEYVEEEIDLNEMTNKELEKFAKSEGINLTTEDKKNKGTRIAAIAAAFEG